MSSALGCFCNNHPEEPLLVQRIYLGSSLILFTIISYVLNLLLLVIVARTHVLDRSFSLHVISLITASIVYLFANTFALIPTTVGALFMKDPWNVILSTADNLGYLALMFTTTNVAVDRFMLFLLPKVHRFLTLRKHLFVGYASIPWLCSVLITLHMATEGCFVRTNPYTLTFTYDCSSCILYGPVLYYFGFIFPGINFVLYTFVYVQIITMRAGLQAHFKSYSSTRLGRRKEVELVFQFSIICAVQFASSACFYVMPPLLPGNDLAFHLPMIISTLNTVTNPIVMLLFQPRLRDTYATLITKCSIASIVPQTSIFIPSRII